MNSNTYFRFKILCAFAFGLLSLCGCQSNEAVGTIAGAGGNAASPSATASATTTATPTATPGTVATVNAEMYFELSSAWDQAPSLVTQWTPLLVDGTFPSSASFTSCSIPVGSSPGTDSTPPVTHTCNFHVPEAQLYYSGVTFTYGSADSANCKLLKFYPYTYELAAGPTPPPPGSSTAPAMLTQPWLPGSVSTVQCYGSSLGYRPIFAQGNELNIQPSFLYLSTGCSNGAGTKVPNYPSKVGIVNETKLAQEFPFSVVSAASLGQGSNRWISNDTASKAAAGASYSGEYRLSSMQDYVLQCSNEFGVLTYEMVITITPDHTTGPPAVLYSGWR